MKRLLILVSTCLLGVAMSATAGPNGSAVVVEGAPAPNSYDGKIPAALEEWCEGACVPLVTLEMRNIRKARRIGELHTWGKNFNFGPTVVQFEEIIIYELRGGQFYTVSQDGSQPAATWQL